MRHFLSLTFLSGTAVWLSLAGPARADTFYSAYNSTDMNSAVFTNDPVQAQLLLNNINGKGVAPAAGNSYVVLSNGYALPNDGTAPMAYLRALANGSASGALAVFNGDSLTLRSNTALRLKNNSAGNGGNTTNVFTNSISPGAPGLILAGGLVENGDNSSNPDTILGVMQAYPGTASYLDTGQNTFQQLNGTRQLRIGASVTGSGDLVIVGAPNSFSNVTTITPGTNNFSGRWIVESGWLVGLTPGSLGTNSSFVLDRLWPMPCTWGSTSGGTPSTRLEPCYDLLTSGSLTLTNGGLMRLHQNCMFSAVTIEGTALTNGTYSYATLTSLFPASFDAGGSGSITVGTNRAVQGAPSIDVQPVSQSVYSGQTAQFTVRASGSPPPAYQWMAGPAGAGVYTNLSDAGTLSGSMTPTLTITNTVTGNAADFVVLVTNPLGAVTSSVATLTVLSPSAQLESVALRLAFNVSPFGFTVIEKSTGLGLLLQTANKFTFGGTAYTVSSASNVTTTATTLDADLNFSGTSAGAHLQFSFTRPDLLQVSLTSSNTATAISQQFADQGENIYGVWEFPYSGNINMRGTASKSFPGGGGGVSGVISGTSGHAPFYVTSRHYAVYVQSDATAQYTLASGGQTSFSFNVPQLTYQIIYGTNYAGIMAAYNALAGGSFMPPVWAFDSIWWKDDDHNDFHNGVTNAQGNVLDTAIQLTNNQIRASSEWIDRPYGTGGVSGDYTSGWGNFDFDPSNKGFNNPAQMVSGLRSMGINLILWSANRCPSNTFLFTNGLALGYLWTDYLGSGPSSDLLITNAYSWFKSNLDVYVNLGIKGYKIDRGEENVQPGWVQNPNQTLFQKLSAEGMAAVNTNDFFIFSRCANDTARQYTALWNGDTYCTFPALQYSVASGLCAGIINFPMWGSDTGGYNGAAPSEELFARWIEFSAYSTLMEVLVGNGRTPWYNYSSNMVAIARAQSAAHHDMIPYSRSCLYQATQTGMPVMCPLVFAFPDDASVANTSDEYLFGPNLLVAPVLTAGASNRNVYLPAGSWFDYNAKSNLFTGPATITAYAPTSAIPLFVREGAIIPRGDIWKGNNNWTPNWSPQLRIEFFPSDHFDSSFPYYSGGTVQTITCSNQFQARTIQFGDLGVSGNLEIYVLDPGVVTRNGVKLSFGTDYTYGCASNLLRVPFSGPTTLVISNSSSLFGALTPLEAWRIAHFGNSGNPAVAGNAADPDGDGTPNFLEYAFGLDPLAQSSNGLPAGRLAAAGGTNYLALAFQRATDATDCTFTVMVAGGLFGPWLDGSSYCGSNIVPVTAATTELSRVPSNGIEEITVRDNVPIGAAPMRFMRLRITNP